MKKSIVLALVLFTIYMVNRAYGQDCATANPKYCKVLCDTAGIKMTLVTLPPGAKLVTHTHPLNYGYALKGGLFKWQYEATGKTESVQMKPGDEFHGGPEPAHHSWNAGKTEIQFLLIEKHD
jgi:quercetin dioxygenase-like cupin family protein